MITILSIITVAGMSMCTGAVASNALLNQLDVPFSATNYATRVSGRPLLPCQG